MVFCFFLVCWMIGTQGKFPASDQGILLKLDSNQGMITPVAVFN